MYPILLIDEEFRVRNQIGALVKNIIRSDVERGLTHFEALKLMLLNNIEETFVRDGN
jgi:flagellar assembly factor FliW